MFFVGCLYPVQLLQRHKMKFIPLILKIV